MASASPIETNMSENFSLLDFQEKRQPAYMHVHLQVKPGGLPLTVYSLFHLLLSYPG